jgi:transposase InsO family protein
MIENLQEQSHLSARETSEALGLGYRRLLRWQKRAGAGAPALARPGPKKTGPLPLEAVRAEVAALRHHRCRSEGTTALYERHQGVISRRELARLVAEERGRQEQARRRLYRRIEWHVPNVAWAIDATERGRDRLGRKLFVHAVQDLCSRYRFEPLVALESKGPAVADHLAKLFRRHGPPLFLKRDNGSPLNAAEVDAVLAEYGVIPLNSPAYYPRYNGVVERGHPGNAGGPRHVPAAARALAAQGVAALRRRGASRVKLQAPAGATSAHRRRGLPSPTARALRQARAVGHF